MGLLEGKIALVFGLANDKSIAWGIIQAFLREGADIGISYAGEIMEKRVKPLAERINCQWVEECDVTKDDQIEAVVKKTEKHFGKIDILVHSIAYAGRDELSKPYSQTSREGFRVAMDISVFSFVALTNSFLPIMNDGGSIMCLTYGSGAVKVAPHYNVMGVAKAALESSTRYLAYDLGPRKIRVNAISAGAIRTLAAAGVGGTFRDMYYTTPSVREARYSVFWSLVFIFLLYVTAPAYAVFAIWTVYSDLVGSAISNLPSWVHSWGKIGLVRIADVNGDGLLQLAELSLNTDVIVLATPEIAGLPYVVSGLVAAGGLAAALSTADGLLLTIANALSHDLYYKMIDPHASTQRRLVISKSLLLIVAVTAAYTASLRPDNILFMVGQTLCLNPLLNIGVSGQKQIPDCYLDLCINPLLNIGVSGLYHQKHQLNHGVTQAALHEAARQYQ